MLKTEDKEQKRVRAAFDRICLLYGLKNHADLQRHFQLSNSYASAAIKRGSMPYTLIEQVSNEKGVTLDWLAKGYDISQIHSEDMEQVSTGVFKGLMKLAKYNWIDKSYLTPEKQETLKSLAALVTEQVEQELQRKLARDAG
ncbi:helix-turn-helix domain-containing protein [Pseudoalteromonas ruthenica]|uniref:helix-turn-helix domain-containing protein n=1 Tax=Pseudoalteromonas ruthenica TaxID=151081 RepID=UPI0014860A32|nr:helix-turn-helix domain-containing protein [Pseudoalteromonas ruthenica]